jgi:hypothetical protein
MRGICNKEAHDGQTCLQTRPLFPDQAQASDAKKKARRVDVAGLI